MTKGRHADIPVNNMQHQVVTVTINDYYSGEYVDSLDKLKTNATLASDYASNIGDALGRQLDANIITALATTSNTVVAGGANITLTKILTAKQTLLENNVPSSELYGLVSPEGYMAMHKINEFASKDYVPEGPFGQQGMEYFNWLGVNWIVHTGLPISGTERSCFIWHKTAVGTGMQEDVSVRIERVPQKDADLVSGCLAMNSVLIQDAGVSEFLIDENIAY
jgi:hypothetical protein